VRRIGAIREENPITAISSAHGANTAAPATASLDAHDVANRIMRKENYLIALFNKDLLDLRVPLPPKLKQLMRASDDGKGRTLTRVFLKNKNRVVLIEGYAFSSVECREAYACVIGFVDASFLWVF
jgi:autophagy-related protein 9